jgi:hypothetical protein
MLEWALRGYHKKLGARHYAKLMFLHPVGSVGRVVHFGVSGARNVDAIIFMLEWDRCGFNKMHAGKRYAERLFLHPVGSTDHVMHSGASGA